MEDGEVGTRCGKVLLFEVSMEIGEGVRVYLNMRGHGQRKIIMEGEKTYKRSVPGIICVIQQPIFLSPREVHHPLEIALHNGV